MGTLISWTDQTWNPISGCTKVSAGCDHCYAEAIAERFRGQKAFPNGFDLTLHPERLDKPLTWKKPQMIFVNSMSDLFHARVPTAFVERIWDVMLACPQHTFQILTKRPERMARFTETHPAPAHIWLGTSVEDERVARRIDALRETDAVVRFLSCEPLIGPLDLRDKLTGIHWVIVGGESGIGHRPMDRQWARDIREASLWQGAAFFYKQDSDRYTERRPHLDGMQWRQFPGHLSPPIPLELVLPDRR